MVGTEGMQVEVQNNENLGSGAQSNDGEGDTK